MASNLTVISRILIRLFEHLMFNRIFIINFSPIFIAILNIQHKLILLASQLKNFLIRCHGRNCKYLVASSMTVYFDNLLTFIGESSTINSPQSFHRGIHLPDRLRGKVNVIGSQY